MSQREPQAATANEIPNFLGRLARRYPGFFARYLSLDPRSLGLARVYLGFLLLVDLLRRVPDMSVWYTNEGLLPNHTLLWRPGARYQFSFFFAASWPGEVAVLFLICGLIFFCFMIGWRTRLMHVLSFICLVSLHDRVIFLENGGDVVLTILIAWTLFLPMGARFSVDALKNSLRRRPDHDAADLGRRAELPLETRPVVSLAVLAILLQVSVIYYFNVVHKNGVTWSEGSVVHYVLHQDRIVTWFGWKLRPYITPTISQVMTYAALVTEALAPVLILNPFGWVWSRRIAIVLLPGLHLSFAFFLNLGMFSLNMIAFFLLLIPGQDWGRLSAALAPRRPRLRTVYFDADCGFCFQVVRVLARLDAWGQLRFVSNQDAAVPPEIDPALLQRTMVVEDPATQRRWTRARGFAEVFASLPFGGPLALLLRVPLLSSLAGAVYDLVARNRTAISMALGFAACGIPQARRATPAPAAAPAGLHSWRRRQAVRLREALVVMMLIALGSQLLMENRAVPAALKFGQADWMRLVVEYPRLFQGWSMFASDAPTGDSMVAVDAITVDGRHVDPLNERGSRIAPAPLDHIPPYLNQDEYWCDYVNRIPDAGSYHGPLTDWILAYPQRTGRPQDQIVSFEVHAITDRSPLPGQTQPTNTQKRLLLRWPNH